MIFITIIFRINNPAMRKYFNSKKINNGIVYLLLLLSIYSLLQYKNLSSDSKLRKDIINKNADIVNKILFQEKRDKDQVTLNKTFVHDKEDIKTTSSLADDLLARKIIKRLNENNETNNIIAYLDTGENGIQEIIAHDPQGEFYKNKNIKGETDLAGTIFLCKENRSPHDSSTTYFGHNMKDGTKFGNLVNYDESKDNLQLAILYTEKGVLNYELVFYAVVNDDWYDTLPTWKKEGAKKFWEEVKNEATFLDAKESFDPLASYMFLSTCFDSGLDCKIVAIYKLNA